ncbi:uncharacterized protein EV422DRAFT_602813 [Fimicolochytrium jonesii]|uniref:uncharacterized protein n=1 Tax=Fimicolochytrium jonesii TaxID=1396493 RepID=UPI0022FE2B11|nr:uncharacterized protein EV422DRAFT_602813 [Fimicolochytrium jonesii]KAI8818160.1 hypothetical protein EV422DRAFT_602813 [Fimicolochytrium jonesii]
MSRVSQALPAGLPAAPKPLNVPNELNQTKNQITNARTGVETYEKAFRESLTFKRAQFQPYAIFSAEVPTTSMTSDEDYANEMILRAKDALLRQSGQKKKLEEEHANQKLDSEEQLRLKVATTRRKFQAKKSLLEAGPKFVHHFCCTYGPVLHVHGLTSRLYVAFASNTWLEFWEFAPGSTQPTLRNVIQDLPTDAITSVLHLFTHEKSAQTAEELDISGSSSGDADSIDVNDDEPIRLSVSSQRASRVVSPPPPPLKMTIKSLRESQKPSQPAPTGGAVAKEDKGSKTRLWGPSTAASRAPSARRRVIGNVLEEDEEEDDEENSDDKAEDANLGSGTELAQEEPETLEPAESMPFTLSKHVFFLGCATGAGVLLTIEVVFDRAADTLTYTCNVHNQRRLSRAAIRSCCFVDYDDVVVCLVSHTGSDQILAAYNLDLEDEWQCKGDVLKYIAKDKQLKVIAQTRLESVRESLGLEDDRPTANLDDSFITAFCADSVQRYLLIAMKSGALLRLNCETVIGGVTGRDREKDTTTLEPEKPPMGIGSRRSSFSGEPPSLAGRRASVTMEYVPPPARKDLFVAWCLDIQPLPTTSLSPVRPPGKSDEEGQQRSPGKAFYSFRTGPEILAKHIRTFLHTETKKPYLLLCCTDGSLRMYAMEGGLATATPVVYTYADQDKDSHGLATEPVLVWADVANLRIDGAPFRQYLMAYTSDGIFLVYAVSTPIPLMEHRILSNRVSQLSRDTPSSSSNSHLDRDSSDPAASAGARGAVQSYGAPFTPGGNGLSTKRSCRMLDPKTGTCIITAGRDWGLVDMRRLTSWDANTLSLAVGKPTTSGRGQSGV